MTDKYKVVSLGLRWCKAVAFAMLPHVTLLTSHRVSSVVEILAVHATLGAVEIPFAVIVLVLFEVFLKLFSLRLQLSF